MAEQIVKPLPTDARDDLDEAAADGCTSSRGHVDLSRFDNDWYRPGSKLKIIAWMFVSFVCFEHGLPVPMAIKRFLLRLFGGKLGVGAVIKPQVKIKYPWLLEVGDHAWIGERCWIDNLAAVTIGSHCCLSQGCYLLTGNHDYGKSDFDLIVAPIVMERGSWVGAMSTVCPGVTLGEHSILAVGSVATHDLEAFGIYQGNPAVFKRERKIAS